MLDLRLIRENPEEIEKKLRGRDPSISLDELLSVDEERRKSATETDALKNKRNSASERIAQLKREGKEASSEIAEMRELSQIIKDKETKLRELEERSYYLLSMLPNIPHDSVPVSQNKEDKIVIREWGEKREFDFPIKNHVELGTELGILDFKRAAKLSGAQFPMYRGLGAQLEMALLNLMLEINTSKGYIQIIPPYLVNRDTMFTSGNLPKFEEQLYKCRDDELYIIPTSEVPLTSLHRGEILSEEELPIRYTAYTACFRREAGTYGAGERGLIRVHQFNKVEMYKYTTPETSYDELEKLVRDAEDILQKLGIYYRITLLVTTDMGIQAAKTYDAEVWLPAQKSYYEVSSCSNCEDFQARRGNIRYRPKDGGRTRFVHTLNGSGLATSRLLVSILESNQQPDGSVIIPEVLRDRLGGIEKISPK